MDGRLRTGLSSLWNRVDIVEKMHPLNGEYHKNQFLKVTGVYNLYDMRICCYCSISAYSFMNIFLVL